MWAVRRLARLFSATKRSLISSVSLRDHTFPSDLCLVIFVIVLCCVAIFNTLSLIDSLRINEIGNNGCKALGNALKINATLTNLKYTPSISEYCRRDVCYLTNAILHNCSPFILASIRSLHENKIGDEGCEALSKALSTNNEILTNLKYACSTVLRTKITQN